MEGNQKLSHVNACFTCLNTTHAESTLMDTEWIKLIEYCTGIMVDLNDRMWKICSQCSEKIQGYAQFKQICEKSNTFWKSILSGNLICQIGQHDGGSADNVKNKGESDLIKTEEPLLNFEVNKGESDLIKTEEPLLNFEVNKGESDLINTEEPLLNFDTVNNIECKEEKWYDDFDGNTFDTTQDEYMLPECKTEILETLNDDVKDELKEESITKIDEKTFKCDSLKVSRKKNRVENCDKSKTQEVHYCGLCEMTSSSLDAVNKHVLEEHSSKNDLNCKMCDYVGWDFAQMEVHRFSHRPEELKSKLVCHICGFLPRGKAWRTCNFEFHYRKEHQKEKGGLCKLCGKSFLTLSLWQIHQKWHLTKGYICNYCGKSFERKYSLKIHIKSAHFNIKDFVCDLCGMAFKQKGVLDVHIETKHTTTERVTCPHCLKSSSNKRSLKKHILNIHMKHKHQFICEVCSRSYPSEIQLNSHMIWHKKDRPFPCEICGLRYKSKSQAKSHQNTVHAGLGHLKCHQCDCTFTSSIQRKRHYLIHTGDTGVRDASHKCNHCKKIFNSKKQLNKHILSFHKDLLTPSQK